MDAFKEIMGQYGRQARLQPALFVVFPALYAVLVWSPTLYNTGATLIGLAAACGVIAFLAHFARNRGRVAESALHASWGGRPTVRWMRHGDKHLDDHTKERYCAFLKKKISGWERPTAEEELQNPEKVDERYDSAVRWLLEHTRDKKRYPLVFSEVVSYGFRRNLYGMKSIGVAVAVMCVAVGAAGIYLNGFHTATPLQWSTVILGAAFLGGWMFIRPDWVLDAADAYAKALLASCEEINQQAV